MIQTTQMLCGYCRVRLKGPPEPNPDDWYACPICGEGDRFEAVMSEVSEYVEEMARQALGEDGTLNGSSTPLANSRRWRFIVDIES